MTPLRRLTELGQSVWYDSIRRDLYRGPALSRLIEEDYLRGMTSNPTIFAKAIVETDLYDGEIGRLTANGASADEIFEELMIDDVRGAADVFRPVFEATGGEDGFVSIEVGPQLARDTARSIAEARRLWTACDRPNVMVKIPATAEGIPAIRQCLAEGININITLLFSVPRYREVMEAYLGAMAERLSVGRKVGPIRSVASFFVSRVDTKIDKALDALANDANRPQRERRTAVEIRGKAAIANARIAYEAFENVFKNVRFAQLRERGAHLQRPLWASTSTKDPAYPDLYYVEALVAPHSVDTMPPETFAAYLERGRPEIRIHDNLREAHSVLEGLAQLKIDFDRIALDLEEEGARRFVASYGEALQAIRRKQALFDRAALTESKGDDSHQAHV